MVDLSKFNDGQREAIKFRDGACCVLASAGSGKTAVLTNRIIKLIEDGIPASSIMAVTFTKKASDEMKERLSNLIGIDAEEVLMGTFHSICYRILREYWQVTNNPCAKRNPADLIAKDWWMKKTVKEIMQPQSNKFPYSINLDWTPNQALSFIGFQKNNLVGVDDTFVTKYDMGFMEDKLRSLYKQYEKTKELEGKIDFDDMLIMCCQVLKNNPDILRVYQNKYKYILVDEYQDTNNAQESILELLARKNGNLFVVGDFRQAIYSFRASNVELILNFKERWNAKLISLSTNYRSTANIVEWSNKLIENNTQKIGVPAVANKPHYKDPIIMANYDEDEEAEKIAQEIDILMSDGYKPKDFAILYRTNAQSRALEEAMMKAKLPYVVLGSANFYSRKEIKDMLSFLQLMVNPENDFALERIVNVPNRYLGKQFIDSLKRHCNQRDMSLYEGLRCAPMCNEWRYKGAKNLYSIITELSEFQGKPNQAIILIRKLTEYDNWIMKDDTDGDKEDNESERIENLSSLVASASKFSTIQEFLEYCEMMATKSSDKNEDDKIKLMTIHRSKGLEFPVVFVAGVGEDLLPHKNSVTDAEIEEERRLCYVGLTRAMKLLYISYSDLYQQKPCGSSQFIDELIKGEKPVWI